MSEPRVLVIDDDKHLCELLAMRLQSRGFHPVVEMSAASGLAALKSDSEIAAIILDLRLGDADGLSVLAEVQTYKPGLPVIVLTAHGSIETAVEAMRIGAFGFMTKPFRDRELIEKLSEAVELSRANMSTQEDVSDLGMVGKSDAMQRVRELIRRVGAADATVLIIGESGTGKELVARALHQLSVRRTGPFVPINCGALPPDLMASELFGHVRGAFTGAVQSRTGLFAAAHGGTLFLDEIGEASEAIQIKLLRVLQERKYTPLGSGVETACDVRILAATNRDLRAEVTKGTFREDLFYRLHVIPLNMPALRERHEDVASLAQFFLQRAAARHGVEAPRVSEEALTVMQSYSWPGNVRELMHVMEAAVLMTRNQRLDASDLTPLLAARESDDASPSAPEWAGSDDMVPLREARESFEREYLREVLRRSKGNISLAARIAGRHRTDFYELMRRHNLTVDEFRSR